MKKMKKSGGIFPSGAKISSINECPFMSSSINDTKSGIDSQLNTNARMIKQQKPKTKS